MSGVILNAIQKFCTMNVEEIRDFALSFKEVTESFPFGNNTLVFKVRGKIFLLMSLSAEIPSFNAKCDPERALELREQHSSVLPGYHMNKKHWNTILINGQLSRREIQELIAHSYELVRPRK